MALVQPHARAKSSSISAVVTRADGRVEDLGIIAYWHRNPFIRWAVNFYIWIKERKRS
jgi:hypothetical protein